MEVILLKEHDSLGEIGDIVNVAPTIAEILGFKNDMLGSGLTASSQSLFDLI